MRETTCSVDKSEKDRRGDESHFRDEKGASSSTIGVRVAQAASRSDRMDEIFSEKKSEKAVGREDGGCFVGSGRSVLAPMRPPMS